MTKKDEVVDDYIPKRTRLDKISQDMDSFESPVVLPSQIKRELEQKRPPTVEDISYADNDEWMSQLSTVSKLKVGKISSSIFDFDENGNPVRKGKKKKKTKSDLTDYDEKFGPELLLLQNLLKEQSAFTTILQKKFNSMEGQKSSVRGVGKYTTDLINSINTARGLNKDIIRDISNLRKTMADLTLKEREKFNKKQSDGLDVDMAGYSAKFLKGLTATNRMALEREVGGIEELDDGNISGYLDDALKSTTGFEEHADESYKYLKYEGRGITVKVRYDTNNGDTEFYAEDSGGNIIEDYPVPAEGTHITLNTSTMIGMDALGQKYPAEYM